MLYWICEDMDFEDRVVYLIHLVFIILDKAMKFYGFCFFIIRGKRLITKKKNPLFILFYLFIFIRSSVGSMMQQT